MNDVEFWKLGGLSDRQLLDGLGTVLGSGRRLVAELVAHLGEVEERRLHLEAACSSMFSYCVHRLGLSEDEACRRIEVARLARRCPAMFPLLAAGKLSLSVAALLKPHWAAESQLDEREQLDLLTAVSGKSVQQAREVLAARFPRPDVPSSLRKLPERRSLATPSASADLSTATTALAVNPNGPVSIASPSNGTFAWNSPHDSGSAPATPAPEAWPDATDATEATTPTSAPAVGSRLPPQAPRASRIEPLAAHRYKVQFTADAELKSKLELARDLMRHVHPSGDFGLIIGCALDLLIENLMKSRFGAGARRKAPPKARPSNTAKPSGYVGRAVRRSVLERDGLRCSWVDERGARCDSRAWLEHDHRRPRAKGGSAKPDNVRLLCRAHNHLAAEREFGRAHIERAVAQKRRRPAPQSP